MARSKTVTELYAQRKAQGTSSSEGFRQLGLQVADWWREIEAGHRALAAIVRLKSREVDHGKD